jgi:uncharacterized membrane protein
MNSETWTRIIPLTLFAALALPLQLAAQGTAKQHHPHQYHHYQFVDVGTFGGPGSGLFNPVLPRAGVLNNRGTLVGWGLTPLPDPFCGFGPPCNAGDALRFQDGVTTDLGKLPGATDSQVDWISQNGLMTGVGDSSEPDPLSGGPQIHGIFWENGHLTDMGTLPEGGYISFPRAVNNRGEVVGSAQNTVPDPTPMLNGDGTQTRAFYWYNGVMQDLGTLGTGTDAQALLINQRGQVVGASYINSVPSAFCSGVQSGFPLTTGTFIWDKKNGMKDIGGLGGTCTIAYDLNNRGQVVGQSNHPDDLLQHPFVWDSATGITELPTGAGVYGDSAAINEGGEIVGEADAPNGQASATLWRKRGGKWHTTYLGSLNSGDCARAASINSSTQVVGVSGPFGCSVTLPFLWEAGGPMVDLNTLIPPNSGIQLIEAAQINDRGEIAAQGPDATGNNHVVLLIPCDESHPGVEGCDYSMVDAAMAAAQSAARPYVPGTTQNLARPRLSNRYHMRGLPSTSR